jgi:5-methylcytosine-specific restriction endonuclease McrA
MTFVIDITEQFLRDDPGHPLGGGGMPTGRPLGEDGSHGARWMRLVRQDPCAYCGGPAGTVDHIRPQCRRDRTTHRWVNWTAACTRCNGAKRDRSLLLFLLMRRSS